MNLTWTSAGIWLLHTAVGGGLLLLLTWLLMRWTRQPALRQRLGEFGLAAAMAVAVFSMAPAWLIVKWPASPVEAAAAAPEVPSEPVVFQLEEGLPGVEGQWHVAGGVAPPLAVEQPAAAPPAEWIDWRETAIAGLVCAFIVGAGWTLGRWVLGWLVLGRLLSRARPASADVAALFDDLTEGQIRARLLVSGWLRVPVSCGLLNPTVLVPASLCA